VAGHGSEPRIDLSDFALADPVYSRLHIVEYSTLRHAAQHPEGLRQCVEQHLVRLQQIGSRDERPTVGELGMGHLQLGRPAIQKGVIFTPIELKGLTGLEDQRYECAAPTGLLFILAFGLPRAGEGGNTAV